MAGKGVGTGDNAYYLFRVIDSCGENSDSIYPDNPRYYIFPANASVSELQSIDIMGLESSAISTTNDPEGYLTTVESMDDFDYTETSQDLPKNFDDLSSDSVLMTFD